MNNLLLRRRMLMQAGGSPTPPTPVHYFTTSVNNTKILFSPGNLQYHCLNGIWRFAEHQWDRIGLDNANISPTYDGWIDLFGWGTSGYHNPNDTYNIYYLPTDSSNATVGTNTDNVYGYGPSYNYMQQQSDRGLIGQNVNYDWGIYNNIFNSHTGNTDVAGTWRTPIQVEWNYVCGTRTTTSGIRYAYCTITPINIKCFMLFPDDWDSSVKTITGYNSTSSFTAPSNTFTEAEAEELESYGVVFLPYAGYRNGLQVRTFDLNYYAYYWSASALSGETNRCEMFANSVAGRSVMQRYMGLSVRLVHDIN